ncbi:Arc family DNA-binding protein [Shinella sumterensis]|nr:Arc family DNA-binding protein [Shinella sumterensis]
MEMIVAREDAQLKLRLTDELKAKVAEAARSNGRSVNAEIVMRLEESFGGEQNLWDEVNRLTDTVQDLVRRLNEVEPRVASLWRRPYEDANTERD